MTLQEYLRVLGRRWRTVTGLALLGVLAAVVVTAVTPATYAATATSFVSLTSDSSGDSSLYQNSQFALSRVKSYTEVVHSPEVLRTVIDDLDLDLSVRELDHEVSAVNDPDTVLIEVQVHDRSARQAAAIANALSDQLGQAVQDLETPASGGAAPVKMTTAVPAEVPASPVSPRRDLNIALGLIVGLALGAVAALVREQLDTTLKTPDDLTSLTSASALGTVHFDARYRTNPLVALESDSRVEDFRTIRTKLQFVNVDSPPSHVVVTSAIASEGKTLTACNLAITLALANLKVCLVEGDLRRPRVATYLGIDGTVGLSDVVAGHYELDEALVSWHRGTLTVLPAGTPPPDPNQLLGSDTARGLLASLKEQFDVVVVDAPPLLPVSDAVVLGSLSDGAILVARHHHVRRDQVVAAAETLREAGVPVLGSVYTHAPARQRQARYGGDGYYDDAPRRTRGSQGDVVAVSEAEGAGRR